MVCVWRPASSATDLFDPTAVISSSVTAIAEARGRLSSKVKISPFTRMRSGSLTPPSPKGNPPPTLEPVATSPPASSIAKAAVPRRL
jgi:hypothetical protein